MFDFEMSYDTFHVEGQEYVLNTLNLNSLESVLQKTRGIGGLEFSGSGLSEAHSVKVISEVQSHTNGPNLSFTDRSYVWEPTVHKVVLDNQGNLVTLSVQNDDYFFLSRLWILECPLPSA